MCVVGFRAAARLETLGHQTDRFFSLPGSVGGLVPAVQELLHSIDAWVTHNSVRTVTVVYNRRTQAMLAEPFERKLLPVTEDFLDDLAKSPWGSGVLPFFRMEREQLFSWLIKQYLFVVLYRALAESLASEHASRLATMQGAQSNIEERHGSLLADYRHKRQEAITRELLDIVAGFEAASTSD
jgi:F-type H+-transporting ATPase subunit gamma